MWPSKAWFRRMLIPFKLVKENSSEDLDGSPDLC